MLLPSGRSHLPLKVPPTPVLNGVNEKSFGLLSLNGAPKKPHTTGPLVVGVTSGPAWMWAATRLSLTSAVCVPVTSMLKIVAVNVMNVIASSMKKLAVPNDAGRGAPAAVVGGGRRVPSRWRSDKATR